MKLEVMLLQHSAQEHLGIRSSLFWEQVAEGLLTRPIKMSARASRWPASEIAQIISARIYGKSEDEIRELVKQLHQKRQQVEEAST